MDYTLVHYHVMEWEARSYIHARDRLIRRGWPIEHLDFEPDLVARGLVIDQLKGNVLKANRFGYIKQAMHGTRPLLFSELRDQYSRELVDLENPRFQFLNTLFSISEGSLYLQLVDLFDDDKLPRDEVKSYGELAVLVRHALDMTHMEGVLKDDILSDPQRYVHVDPDTALALYDQKMAGKKLMVITNSGWEYTKFMMEYAIGRFLPDNMSWRELFDITVVSARKPAFFLNQQPIFEIINDEGHLKPVVGKIKLHHSYLGGTVSDVEKGLHLSGDQILFVGDHIYGDVNVSKRISRWRTALILRELESEIDAIYAHRDEQHTIAELMSVKMKLENELSAIRLLIQRLRDGYGLANRDQYDLATLEVETENLHAELRSLDERIAPLVQRDGRSANKRWGYMMRAGNDKSLLTQQVERHADIYTSRVSNFLSYSPFMYFRAPRGTIPHDPNE